MISADVIPAIAWFPDIVELDETSSSIELELTSFLENSIVVDGVSIGDTDLDFEILPVSNETRTTAAGMISGVKIVAKLPDDQVGLKENQIIVIKTQLSDFGTIEIPCNWKPPESTN
ncbi:MAG: hypothetical protein R3C03_18915 [Pirellulaceae bacterium]